MKSVVNCKLYIDEMLASVDDSSAMKNDLNLALQSVAKRANFSHLHFHELFKYATSRNLMLERAGIEFTDAGDVSTHRTQYEANTFALAQNLHSACDSFPFVITLMLGELVHHKKPMRPSRIGWNENTYISLCATFPKQKKLHRQFISFAKDKDFLMLKGLVNQTKHMFLVRILNLETHISFEKFRYYPYAWKGNDRDGVKKNTIASSEMVLADNINILEFMQRFHNRLLPKLFILFWRLYEARIQEVKPFIR